MIKNNTLLLTITILFLACQTSFSQLVTNGADDGSDGTLRAEIADTPAGGEITFSAAVSSIILNSELLIDKELTITGSSTINTIINADGNGRAFNITEGPVTFNNLNIINGNAEDGGGIFVTDADLFLTNCEVTNNFASNSGGGIYIGTGGEMVTNNVSISNNEAVMSGGGITHASEFMLIGFNSSEMIGNTVSGPTGNGGAIHLTSGDMQILLSDISDNTATNQGGAIWVSESSSLTVSITTLNGNVASGDDADSGGGAIYNDQGFIGILDDSVISNNLASGISGSGGGIFNNDGSLFVVNSTLENNAANRAGGGIETVAGLLEVEDSSLLANNVNGVAGTPNPGNGGGIHVTGMGDILVIGSVINDNLAATDGGGLWNGLGPMTIDASEIDGNRANGNAADQGGGGIYNLSGILTIQNGSTITNNAAFGDESIGGGIWNDVGGTLEITDSEISNNFSRFAGGGIEDNSGAGTTLSITNVAVRENESLNPGIGGGLHVAGDGDAIITNSTFSGNITASEGAGLWNDSGTMTINNSLVDANQSFGDFGLGGGGVFNNVGTLIIQNESIITNNLAGGAIGSGGGILSVEGTITISESTVNFNQATRAGAGIEIIDGVMNMTASALNANNADGLLGSPNPGNGGGLHISGQADVTIDRSTINGNLAFNEGAGIWNQSNSTVTISRSTLNGNIVDQIGGGALYNNGGIYMINSSTLSNNRASNGSGGAIFNESGSVELQRSTLSGNTAAVNGGGIYNNESLVTNAVTLTLNESTGGDGGGIFSVTDTFVKNSIIADNIAITGNDLTGLFVSSGYNVIGTDDTNAFPEEASDQEGITPFLGPLQDNGGDTFTHALLSGSVGIDSGDPTDLFNDQRDYAIDGIRDSGAYEFNGVFSLDDVHVSHNSFIYPNPANNTLFIKLRDNTSGAKRITIISLGGQIIQEHEATSGINQFNLNTIADGIYFVHIEGNQLNETHKLVVE